MRRIKIHMSHPTTKTQLVQKAEEEFSNLLKEIETVSNEKCNKTQICGVWTIKDIIAHLYEWHNMLLGWYKLGMEGKKPQMPAPGYSWKDTPKLNQHIYEKYKNSDLQSMISALKSTHNEVLHLAKKHTDTELFTKKKYAWTASTSMSVYFNANTASHYRWAKDIIKKSRKGPTT